MKYKNLFSFVGVAIITLFFVSTNGVSACLPPIYDENNPPPPIPPKQEAKALIIQTGNGVIYTNLEKYTPIKSTTELCSAPKVTYIRTVPAYIGVGLVGIALGVLMLKLIFLIGRIFRLKK